MERVLTRPSKSRARDILTRPRPPANWRRLLKPTALGAIGASPRLGASSLPGPRRLISDRWVSARPLSAFAATILLAALVPLAFAERDAESPPHFIRVIGDVAPLGYLNAPMGIAVSPAEDARLYVVDTDNARVAVFSAEGQPIGSWGERGSGPGRFWLPSDVAVSRDGKFVYVVDQVQAVVQRFEPRPECFEDTSRRCFAPERVRMWGGRGFGDGAFQKPTGIAVDDQGSVYVSDSSTNSIQVFSGEGSHLRTFGSSGEELGQLSHPTDLAIGPDGALLVADRNNDRIAYFTEKGEAFTYFNGGGRFHRPTGIAVAPDGVMLVRDYEPSFGTPRVWRFDTERRYAWQVDIAGETMDYAYPLQGIGVLPSGAIVATNPTASEETLVVLDENGPLRPVALRGRSTKQFDYPADAAIDPHFNVIADRGNHRILVLDPLDRPISIVGGEANPVVEFAGPSAVAVHRWGPELGQALIYALDSDRHQVHVISPEGTVLQTWGGGPGNSDEHLNHPEDIAVAPDGDVYIADTNNHRVVRRGSDGTVKGIIGGDPEIMEYPISVAVGPLDLIYVVEARKNRVQAFDPQGETAFVWHSDADPMAPARGEFWLPVAVSGDASFVYVMESEGREHVRIQVFTVEKEFPSNVFTVFAEGAGANPGRLWDPADLSVGANGQILIADGGNNRVQLFAWPGSEPPATPTLTPSPTALQSPTQQPTSTDLPEEPTDIPTAEPDATATLENPPTIDLPTNVAPTAEVQPTPTAYRPPEPIYLPFALRQ